MFGEYALYLNTKVVAFVCDNKLFLKPTDAGRAVLGAPVEAPAYPGSRTTSCSRRSWKTQRSCAGHLRSPSRSCLCPSQRPRQSRVQQVCLPRRASGPSPRVRPNPSLNTGPSAAGCLAREAPVVYPAPRGQASPPLRAG
ncbi:MAG: hypothetical protein NOF05_13210 [Candidatus Accumulibacter phosphatis]|nr:hypothetical protein [Candidatus Accumulibacter phosphatis]